MAVVINEFEARTEAAPAEAGNAGGGTQPQLRQREVGQVLKQLSRRRARIWAH